MAQYPQWWINGSTDWRLWMYFINEIIGGVGLTLLMISIIGVGGRYVRRNPVLVSFCFSWWLGAFPNTTFLFFANKVSGPEPSQTMCLASAALVMANTPLNASCAVMLVYNVWALLQSTDNKVALFSKTKSFYRTLFMVTAPYIAYLVVIVSVIAVGLAQPETVRRETFYCVVHNKILTMFTGCFSAVCCITAIGLEVAIALLLRRSTRHQDVMDSQGRLAGMDLALVLRVVGFGFYIVFGLGLSIMAAVDWTSVVPDLCFSTFGIAVFLVFGSQRDILRLWKRWFLPCCQQTERNSRRTISQQIPDTPRTIATTTNNDFGGGGGAISCSAYGVGAPTVATRDSFQSAELEKWRTRSGGAITSAGSIPVRPYNPAPPADSSGPTSPITSSGHYTTTTSSQPSQPDSNHIGLMMMENKTRTAPVAQAVTHQAAPPSAFLTRPHTGTMGSFWGEILRRDSTALEEMGLNHSRAPTNLGGAPIPSSTGHSLYREEEGSMDVAGRKYSDDSKYSASVVVTTAEEKGRQDGKRLTRTPEPYPYRFQLDGYDDEFDEDGKSLDGDAKEVDVGALRLDVGVAM